MTIYRLALTALVAMPLALAACGKSEPTKKELAHSTPVPKAKDASETPAPPAPTDAGLREHMEEHFEAIRNIERAIVIGDKETAREQAALLADQAPAKTLLDYAEETTAVREAALALAKEESIEGMARGAATLASRCGSCHLATTSITSFAWTEAPAEDGDSKARMQRHLWAMDRLWEGLVGPSEMSWQAGSVVLLAAPFPVDRLPLDAKSQADAKVQLAKIAALAVKAKDAVEAEDRMAVYGELLGTCSGCHTKNR